MVRKAHTQPVTPQMYRHFAVLTIAITAAVALFADGENREAMASEIRPQTAPAPAPTPAQITRKDGRGGGFGGGAEFDSSFGEPMDSVGSAASDGVIPNDFAVTPSLGLPGGVNRYGVPAHVWNTLSDAQKRDVMARHAKEQAAASSPDRAQQIDGLLAASRARSGEATAVE